ncbi:MAG: ComEC/Rec2 family competence protein [Chloroflexi bacterium]|nr:ComEC/Rec2 family competence protein [Chloroflexota bacterium]
MRAALLAAAWVAGAAAGTAWSIPLAALAFFLGGALFLSLLARINGWPLLAPIVAAVLLLGAARGSDASHYPDSLAPWIGKPVMLEGLVISDPEPRGTALRFWLQTHRLWDGAAWQEVRGDVLVTASPSSTLALARAEPHIRYGDVLALEGVLREPPSLEGFDYREHLARQGIQALMDRTVVILLDEGKGWSHYAWAYSVRRALVASLARALPEPQASLAQAIFMGYRTHIPSDVEQAFLTTGATHLLAISGMNMTMVLALALPLSILFFGRRRNLYLLAPLALLWVYAYLSGLSPSVVRAVLMASAYLGALALGRPYAAWASLGLASALMVAHHPYLVYDLSFQLSFTSVVGILSLWRPTGDLLLKLLERPLAIGRWPGWLRVWLVGGAAVSIAAVLATAPVLAFHFQQVSLTSVPATVLVLPTLPLIMTTAFAAGTAGLLWDTLGQLVAWTVWLPVTYMVWVVKGMAKLPLGLVHLGDVGPLLVAAYYLAGAGVFLLVNGTWRRLREWAKAGPPRQDMPPGKFPVAVALALGPLVLAVAVAWTVAASLPDGRLHVIFLDVGEGDAILIQTPEGHQVLVDGGPSPNATAARLGRRMPFWDRALELVAVSHYHEDHLAGLLGVLRRYQVPAVLDSPFLHDSATVAQWKAMLQQEGAVLVEAQAGQTVRLGREVVLEVLGPPLPLIGGTESDINNNSTVLRLRYREFSLLLMGDAAQAAEALLLAEGVQVESSVLKVGHHGSASSSSGPFLAAVRPLLAVVSAGEGNPFGHPSPLVAQRLQPYVGDSRLLSTADHGDVALETDGRTVWVRLER